MPHVSQLLDPETQCLIAFAWPGGYPVIYWDAGNNLLCPDCANKARRDNLGPVGGDVYYEGPAVNCEGCPRTIESAYGDPDADPEGVDDAWREQEAEAVLDRKKETTQ